MRETTIRSRSLATDDLSPEGTKRQKAMFGLQALTTSHDGMWQIGQASWSADQDAGTITFTSYQVSSGPAQTRTEKRTRGGLISTDGGSGDMTGVPGTGSGDSIRVRRGKVLDLSGCKSHPASGSLQPAAIEATRGGNETVGAFETDGSLWRLSEPTGRNRQSIRGHHTESLAVIEYGVPGTSRKDSGQVGP
jgi:hypothetical protein